jgi:hypothetical protein
MKPIEKRWKPTAVRWNQAWHDVGEGGEKRAAMEECRELEVVCTERQT